MVDPENKTPENKVSPPERQYPDPKKKIVEEPPTTGHVWDGIEEYDNPMPRWWLWTFYITIVWAIIYMILYPAWPLVTKATSGILGYSSRAEVANEIADFEARNEVWFQRLNETEIAALRDDDELERFAVQAGGAVFAAQCSQCHGTGGAGVQAAGYPNLLDDDWLWGGTLEDIHLTVAHGIRNETDPQARFSQMPAFGRDGLLDVDEVDAVVEYVLSLSGQSHDEALAEPGGEIFQMQCAACHGADGAGDHALGAPALNNQVWLYGGDRASIRESIWYSRAGVMPAFDGRLREAEIRAVSVYVHQLGGGE
ncbi:cytochrome-c oxidase, cbb3-type subunit III [Alkalilacustris brevis]|uniref:cytochrome-c oxidase, cbb3-type subunit III n=1 Tax=Alkalilacustris brevis TaxID=2026338 RepID=UPI000E0DEA0C|nr:cytochrome-c oxidase, cbb3-type subunit III [Alkalilacustris brevis]